MWSMTNNEASARITLFHYSPTSKPSEADWMLGDFSGALMTDGYAVYDSVCKTKQLDNLGCWAHARHYFKEARDEQDKEKSGKANTTLAFIQKLFRIEKLSENKSIDEKYQIRQAQTSPLLDELRQWLDKTFQRPMSSEKLKKSVMYLHNQWPKLIRYMETLRG
jgi:transposase